MTPAWFPDTRSVNGPSYQSYWHNGDNGFNYAWLEVVPGANLSFAIATNLTGGFDPPVGPARPAVNAMKQHCVDLHEHYEMIGIMGRNFSDSATVSFGAGSVGSLPRVNDENFSTGASFNSAGSAIKFTFPSSRVVNKVHLSNNDGKIRKFAIDKWVQSGQVGGWVTVKEVPVVIRDAVVVLPSSTSTQFRLRVLDAVRFPVTVDEFWLMSY
jgi:hypothetical protein